MVLQIAGRHDLVQPCEYSHYWGVCVIQQFRVDEEQLARRQTKNSYALKV